MAMQTLGDNISDEETTASVPLECIQSILYHPLVKDFIRLSPFRLYESAAKTMHFYTEWLSGDVTWSMQVGFFF